MIRFSAVSIISCTAALAVMLRPAWCEEAQSEGVYRSGALAGSLKSETPLPLYDGAPGHLWNRLFAVLYVRTSNLPAEPGGPPIARIEGGDMIDFLAWGRTRYWSSPELYARLNPLLDEFLNDGGVAMIEDPLRRAVFLRDLWAAYDHLVEQNSADSARWRPVAGATRCAASSRVRSSRSR
jgi:hypothetical protein